MTDKSFAFPEAGLYFFRKGDDSIGLSISKHMAAGNWLYVINPLRKSVY